MKKLSILTILFLSIISAQPGVDVPGNMSFQGFLTDSEGVAYSDGQYDLIFRLIRQVDETTEQTIWEESHSASVTNGVFSVILGSVTPLPLSISPNVQLETQVGDETLSPRQPLTSVPFALKSSRSQQAYQSVLSDTAMVALNAPMADTAQFSYHSQHANHADSSIFSAHSQHAVHADTAYYVDQAQSAINAQNAEMAINATYSDTANYAFGIVGGIEVDDVQNATYADTAYYVEQAQNALTANEAISAESSTYADTAYYAQEAQSALTAVTSQNSTNATYADTAEFVDLSQHGQNILVAQSNNANITLYSDDEGSTSRVTLIARDSQGQQNEMRLLHDAGSSEFRIYDSTNDNTLVTVGDDGKITATSFVGDGSGLTGISAVNSLNDLGITVSSSDINYLEGVSSNIQNQLDSKTGITQDQASAIEANTAKVGYTDALVSANSDVVANTAKVGLTNDQLNLLNGITATTAELNYVATVSSNIQDQLDAKQASDADLTDLADGTLSASKVENNEYFITSAGTSGQVWTSDGSGAGDWSASVSATSLDGLTDATTEGYGNIGIGGGVLGTNEGGYNLAVGYDALKSNVSASFNTSLGHKSLRSNNDGEKNVAIGYSSLYENISGSQNSSTGYEALKSNTTGSYNSAYGYHALQSNLTGASNIGFGMQTLYNNTTGDANTAIGRNAGMMNTTGSGNIFIGFSAGNNTNYQIASNKLAIANSNTTTPLIDGDFSAATLTINGALSATSISGGDVSSTEFAYLDGVTSAIQTQLDVKQAADDDLADLADGTLSASKVENAITTAGTSGQVWTSDGDGAGIWSTVSTGATNLNGLSDALVEGNSLYLGEDPSATTNSASYNVSIGKTALENITSGNQNVAVGYNALEENTSGSKNVGIGYQALENTSTGSSNTAVGRTSLPFNTSGDGNTGIGHFSLYYNSTGNGNVAIGETAGQNNTTGSDNVFLGKGAGANSNHSTASNKLIIANSNTTTPLIDGDFSAATLKINGSLEVTGSITKSVGAVQSVNNNGGNDSEITVNAEVIPVLPINGGYNITIGDGSFDGQKVTIINTSDNLVYITNTSTGQQYNFAIKRAHEFYWYSDAWYPNM